MKRSPTQARSFFLVAAAFFFGATPIAFAAPQETRTWSDSTGKFRVEATLVSQDGDSVKLRKTDGRTVTIPTAKLSDSDRDYLERNGENPFAGGDDASGSSDATAGSNVSVFKISGKTIQVDGFARPIVVGDRTQEKKTTFDGVAGDWKVVPPTRAVEPRAAIRPVPLFADSRIGKFAAILNQKIVASPAADGPFYVGFDVGVGADAKNYLERCDVATGTGKMVDVSGAEFKFCDVSPDGKFALGICKTKNKFGLATPTLLAFFPLERFGESPKLDAAAFFYPFFDANAPDFSTPPELVGATWLDSTNVLTTTRENAVLWNLATGRSVYSFPIQNSTVALDPTRSLGTLASSEKVVFFEPKTGDFLGKVDLPPSRATETAPADASNSFENVAKQIASAAFYPTTVAFSPDGSKFAVETSNELLIFNGKSGERSGAVAVDRPFNAAFGWANADSLLVGSILYDVASGVPICDYRGAAPGVGGIAFANGRVWTICGSASRSATALVGFELPHPAAVDALKKLDLTKNFALYPGVSVALRLELNGLLDEKTTRDFLEANLKKQGFKVASNAKVVLTARCVRLEEEVEAGYSVDSSRSGMPRPPFSILRDPELGSVKLKVFEESLELVADGKSLWKNEQKTTGPQNVEYDSKKTLEQTVRDANKPEIEFFQYARTPKYVLKSGGGGSAILQAILSPDGVR